LKTLYKLILLFALSISFSLLHNNAFAQVKISGTVYDMSRTRPLSSVSVLSSSGIGTVTDSTGSYTIVVRETDSIWFSYLNKPTPKFPVAAIANTNAFDIALHVPVTELKEVHVAPRNYKFDSVQNRLNYAKAFEFQKPHIKLSAPESGNFGVGLDLDELINMFSFKKNRRMLAFQRRLIQEEQDKAVDHRFTKVFVKKITQLTGAELDDFMVKYRPSYEFTMSVSDYDFAEYIKLAWQEYERRKKIF
jgi:hypothetical protein